MLGILLHRMPLPTVVTIMSELIAEKTCFDTCLPSLVLVNLKFLSSVVVTNIGFIQLATKPMSKSTSNECNYCREKGHWKNPCAQLIRVRSLSSSIVKMCSPSILYCISIE